MTGLVVSLYPIQQAHAETLSEPQTKHFNQLLHILKQRIKVEGIDINNLDLNFDGTKLPLPFPDLHWELATCWMVIDGTLPSKIPLPDFKELDYQGIILRDPPMITKWREAVRYARSNFKHR